MPHDDDVLRSHRTAVRRLIDEVINAGRLEVADQVCTPDFSPQVREWVTPFRTSFPDVHMRTIALVAEGDQVAGRFTCSGTHRGAWLGHPPTGRRFEDVDEVYFFRFQDGLIAEAWGLEDNASRLRQLDLT